MSALQSLVLKTCAGTGECYDRDDVPVCREKIYDCLLHKIKGSTAWEGGGTPPQMASVQCAGGRSILCLSDAAQKWGSQHWKGPKISSLSIFLVLPYLMKTAILPHPLLLHPPGAEHKSR